GGKPPRVPDARAEPGTGRVRLLARAGGRQHGDHHRLRLARRRRRAGPASPRLSGRRVEAAVVGHRASPLRAVDARLPAAHDRAGRPADRGHPAAGARARPACRVTQDEEELLRLLVRLSYFREPGRQFRLASGRTSDYYIECALTTTNPAAIPLIGALVHARLPDAAVAFHSAGTAHPVAWFSVRKAAKEHGATRWLEGSARPGDAVVVVEDVITSGGSLIEAVRKCHAEGLRVLRAVVLVDREEDGGRARVEKALAEVGADFEALFTRSQIERAWQAARG